MAIALGADHAGFALKERLKGWLVETGHTVIDFGTHAETPVDYPDFAVPAARAVAEGRASRALLVCGTGAGMAMTANKLPGIRAVVCADATAARLSRQHNDANVLALGSRLTSPEAAVEILGTWLTTSFEGGRHARRLGKVALLEHGVPVTAGGEHAHARAR